MIDKCPADVDLLLFAVAADAANTAAITQHLNDCGACRQKVSELSDTIIALTSTAGRSTASNACLDDVAIARLADIADWQADAESLTHVASCARCREQLAGVVMLLRDPAISAEVERLTPQGAPRRSRALPMAALASLAAAALAGVLLWPEGAQQPATETRDSTGRRDGTVTTTVAPRLLTPAVTASVQDSLRWTSVPRADVYRITIWDRAGTVVFQTDTRDTTLALPPQLLDTDGALRLWKVEARTGWDRWVASELGEFRVRPARR